MRATHTPAVADNRGAAAPQATAGKAAANPAAARADAGRVELGDAARAGMTRGARTRRALVPVASAPTVSSSRVPSSNAQFSRAPSPPTQGEVTRVADMFSAMGSEPRLRIVRLLLSAHPGGLIVGDIASELDIAASTLSHHLDKLKNRGLVRVRREGTCLWYTADTDALAALLAFLYAECCTRNQAVEPGRLTACC